MNISGSPPPFQPYTGSGNGAAPAAPPKKLATSKPDIKAHLLNNMDSLNDYLATAADDSGMAMALSKVLKKLWKESDDQRKNQIACLCCTDMARLENIETLDPLKHKLYARNIVQNPESIGQLSRLSNKVRLPDVLHYIFMKMQSDHAVLDTLTEQLHRLFQSTGQVPPLCFQWAQRYLLKYPDMFSAWIDFREYDASDKDLIRKLLFSPVDELKMEDLQHFLNLDMKYESIWLDSFLLLFVQKNIEQLARRVDLLPMLLSEVRSCCYRSQEKFLPVMTSLSSELTVVMKEALKALKEKLMEPVGQINSRTLFEQWKAVLSAVQGSIRELNLSDSYHPAFWQQWQKELIKCRNELVTMAHNSEALGKDEYWKEFNFGAFGLRKFFPYLSEVPMRHPPDNPVTETLQLVRHSDQKRFIIRWHQQMSEKELVIIATRAVPDIAGHIIHNTRPLSLEALAEIGRHHPQLIMPLLERGDFQLPAAVPDLVRFASAFKPLAEAVYEKKYNQHLPPSWQGQLVADFPELSERLWTDFCQKHSGTDTPVSDEWSQALAHICQHETIARKILQYPATAKNNHLLAAIGCHHKSLVDKDLIDTLSKNHLYGLIMVIRTHGIAPFETMLDSRHNDIFAFQVDNDCLRHSSDKKLNFQAAMAWRDKAETIADNSLWQSQCDSDKTTFLKHWPYLKERFPASRHFNLGQALKLLETPLKWSELDSKAIINICQFPAVAEKICFEQSFQALADKLTEEEKFAIYSWSEKTSDRALKLESLNNDQVCRLLGQYPRLHRMHSHRLLKCTNKQIAEVYSNNKQSDNVVCLLAIGEISLTDIGDKLNGDDWFKIAHCHKKLALLLFTDRHKKIRKLLSNDQLYELALEHREIVELILDKKVTEIDILAWTPDQWITLCEYHPECFRVIYQQMIHAGPEYQKAVSKAALLELRDQPDLWHQILACVSDQDRQWLSDKSASGQSGSLPATCRSKEPAKKYDADFYSFNHPLSSEMPKDGCCTGYARDFIRYARKGKKPSAYVRKDPDSRFRPYSVVPYRVGNLQRTQCEKDVKCLSKPSSHDKSTLDLAPCIKYLNKGDGLLLTSHSHTNAMIQNNGDIYYFDPNRGIWRWRNFQSEKHLSQLTHTVKDTLLETGKGYLKVEMAKEPEQPAFPKKRKATFDPGWISKKKPKE